MKEVVAAFLVTLLSAASHGSAPEVLAESGVKGGLIVHLGCGDGSKTSELRVNDKFTVQGLDRDERRVAAARKAILARGGSGGVSFMHLEDDRLPYVDDLVNLLIVENSSGIAGKEMLRVLAPLGVLMVKEKGTWTKHVKPWPDDIDEWTHYLRDPQNSAVARDERIGQPRSLRWSAPPRFSRSHDEMASMVAMVTARGRLFYIMDVAPVMTLRFPAEWKLVAVDAFSGKKLWERSISSWVSKDRAFRSGPAHLPRRLVAAGDRVFVTLGLDASLVMLDAATGDTLKTYENTEWTEEILVDNNRLYLMVGSSEKNRSGEGLRETGEPEMSRTRFIRVIDIESGREIWSRNASGKDYVLPLSLVVSGENLFFHTVRGIFCVDAGSGKDKWVAGRRTVGKRLGWATSTIVVSDDVLLCADRSLSSADGKKQEPAESDIEWNITTAGVAGFGRIAKQVPHVLTAYSVKHGKELWSVAAGQGVYNSPSDVFVIDGQVWVSPEFRTSYDLHTGKVATSLKEPRDKVGMLHDRCHRNKATINYILTSRDGVEFIHKKRGWQGNNSWLRGMCQYGIMPANGMIYISPDACACHLKNKLQGFNAVSSQTNKSVLGRPVKADGRLLRGPAYGKVRRIPSSGQDWPMYRSCPERSGCAKTGVADNLRKKWAAEIGGHLTQPVSAWGKVFVASVDRHAVYALDAADGKVLWSYAAGGRVDSAPTLFEGLVVFGSADGCVYALDNETGRLAWRFHAAPAKQFIMVNDQIESSWPVHGSVLLHNGDLVFTAGRSSYLDGGLYYYRLDPLTGELLASSIISSIDPATDKQTEWEHSFDSGGSLSDIMSSDGRNVYLKDMPLDGDGNRKEEKNPHLWTSTGFLGEDWFVRAYWLYGTARGAGWMGWMRTQSKGESLAPVGRIMSFDSDRIFGYGRVTHSLRETHSNDKYHLYASVKQYPPRPPKLPGKRRPKARRSFIWQKDSTTIVRAMVLTDGKLVVAGMPDLLKRLGGLSLQNPEESVAAYGGEKGSLLKIVSVQDGKELGSLEFHAAPVFDGMAAANGRLFISLKNGEVHCYQ